MLHSKDHYVAQFNTRFERPIVKGYDGILVGNGCLAAVHWQPRNYKVQLNHADLIGLTQCLSFEMIFQRPITELSGSLLSELHMDQGYYEVQYQKKEAVGKASWCYRGKVGGSPEEQALDYGSFRMESYVHPHQDIYRLNYNGDGPVHQPNAITFELSGILKEQGCTNYDIQEDGLLLNLQINEQTFSLRLQADAGNWEIPNAPITQFSLVGDLQHFSTLSIQTSFNHNPIITNDRDEKEQLRNYWQNFWERSYVDAGHPYLNALYHSSLFNLGASSKGQRFVPFNGGLNLWNNNLRYWGDHVWCHNQSQVYLGLNACNHSDLSENFITWILGEQNAARALAKERFSCGGVHY